MKKAQVLGQVIIFLLAALTFIFILTYGYKAINTFLEQGRTVALIDLKTELETAVESVSRDYGSTRTYTFAIPTEFHTLCIVDPKPTPELQAQHPLLYNAVLGGAENVFLMPLTSQQTPIHLEQITIPNGYICLENIKGSATLRFEGLGNKARITLP